MIMPPLLPTNPPMATLALAAILPTTPTLAIVAPLVVVPNSPTASPDDELILTFEMVLPSPLKLPPNEPTGELVNVPEPEALIGVASAKKPTVLLIAASSGMV